MRKIKMIAKNKKGISEIVGYVLLIIIAVGMSILIYSYLKFYVPKEKPTCSEDIVLSVTDYNCSIAAKNLTLQITNKGLFKANLVYLRLGASGQTIKPQIEKPYTVLISPNQGTAGLDPEESFQRTYNVNTIVNNAGQYILELEPAVAVGSQIALCDKSLITYPIECN